MFPLSDLRPWNGLFCIMTNVTFLRAFTLTIVLTNQIKWMSSYTLKQNTGTSNFSFSKLSSSVICSISGIRSNIIVLLLEEHSWLQPYWAVNSDWERYEHSLVKIISKTINRTSEALSSLEWELYCLKTDILRRQRFTFCSTVQSYVNPTDLSLSV